MSERITVKIPPSQFPTNFEVWEYGLKKRTGGVQPGAIETSVKITSPREDCEIRIIPCDHQGRPIGQGYVYRDESLIPIPPANVEPPVEPCCEKPKTCERPEVCPEPERFTEATEIKADAEASVVLEKVVTVTPAEPDDKIKAGDKVYDFMTDDEGHLDKVQDVTDEFESEPVSEIMADADADASAALED